MPHENGGIVPLVETIERRIEGRGARRYQSTDVTRSPDGNQRMIEQTPDAIRKHCKAEDDHPGDEETLAPHREQAVHRVEQSVGASPHQRPGARESVSVCAYSAALSGLCSTVWAQFAVTLTAMSSAISVLRPLCLLAGLAPVPL